MPSADGIAAAFPHTILEKINGTPSRIDIDDAQEKQTENAASRPSTRGGGAHGHAGMVVPPAQYVVEFLLQPTGGNQFRKKHHFTPLGSQQRRNTYSTKTFHLCKHHSLQRNAA